MHVEIVVAAQKEREFLLSGTPFLLLVSNYLNTGRHILVVPFFVSKKEIIKKETKVKCAAAHVYCCTITMQTYGQYSYQASYLPAFFHCFTIFNSFCKPFSVVS